MKKASADERRSTRMVSEREQKKRRCQVASGFAFFASFAVQLRTNILLVLIDAVVIDASIKSAANLD
jgi:hypothetical protein